MQRRRRQAWHERGRFPTAMIGALLGAATIMLSPLTPWPTALVVGGCAWLLPSVAVLVVRFFRNL
jgi:hypothetical protein